ncbi:MAG: SOS response-associated peptidase [Woeseia sp.]|nr:SOS response-associated peptidase [Woeseia sp.]MBT8095803.1 SOS response-associated peptidase [Woeseia sp.]NNE61747.1 SOS response-associated peptidase [Woeseia sp.]NNL54160.1 SOS response-associated peptidase [Woeseia sp.]
MCGRFAFYSPSEATAALFGVKNVAPVEPRYNIAPTQYIAAIRDTEEKQRELTMLRWGLVPFWAKDPAIGNRMINARAETVAEKPSFRNAFKKRRCLILADGFYEWRKESSGKTPYFISPADGEPFAFAGLWEAWQDKSSEDTLETATIITTGATEFMEALHHRMPVILRSSTGLEWLQGSTDLLDRVAEITPKMRAWPVSRTVNNARNEGEDLLTPAGDELVEA